MESNRTLVKRFVFGTCHDGEHCLHWMDDGSLLYPVGKTVVLQQPNSCHQRFLEAAYQSTAITAVAMSANKKFVAIAESGAHPQIQIIDTVTRKRRKVLSVPELDSDRYVALSFSSDGRHLVTQGGAPGWNLHYWNWERTQPLGSVSVAQVYQATPQLPQGSQYAAEKNRSRGEKAGAPEERYSSSPHGSKQDDVAAAAAAARAGGTSRGASPVVTSIGVCPHDPLLVSIAGVGFFRFYRYTDGLLQPQPSAGIPHEQYEVFSTHVWVSEHSVVAATKSGGLHLIQEGRYVQSIDMPLLPFSILKSTGGGAGRVSRGPNDQPFSPTTAATAATDVVTCLVPTWQQQQPQSGGNTHNTRAQNGFVAATENGQVYVFQGDAVVGRHAGAVGASEQRHNESNSNRSSMNYRFVCRMEVPVYESGEQAVAMVPSRGRGTSTAPANAAAGDTTASPPSAHSVAKVAAPTAEATHLSSRKGRAGKLFELRHDTRGGPSKASTTNPHATAAGGGGANRGSIITAARGRGSVLDQARASTVGINGGATTMNENLPGPLQGGTLDAVVEAEAQLHRRRRITALALDQGEECLAVLTAAGKLYGLPFKQNWSAREEMFQSALTTALQMHHTNSSLSDATSAAVAALPGVNEAGDENALLEAAMPGHSLSRQQQQQQQQQQQLRQPRAALFQPLYPFTHSGRVNGLDCSVRKPLLITSGSDHSVRVWNTKTGQLLMCEFFPLEPGAVALHPDGLMAVVCFSDKVRVMSVLWNSLRERRSINLRNALDVQFARGGQLFAVVHNNLVDVFNSYTCELQGQLRGHPQRIRGYQWCSTTPYPTDNRAVTCSLDGMIVDWNISEMRKQTEHFDKRFQYVAVASDDHSVWAVAAPTSATAMEVSWKVLLREIDRQSLGIISSAAAAAVSGGVVGAAAGAATGGPSSGNGGSAFGGNSVGDYEFTETALTTLAVAPHHRVLVAGAEDGSVKPIAFPLQAGIQEAPLTAHASPVTRMALSFDESTLFTAAADGTVMMWEVYSEGEKAKGANPNPGGNATHADPSSRSALNNTEEVLVTRQEMEEHAIEIESLQHYIEKLKTDMEGEDKRRAHEQGTWIREKAEELQHVAVSLVAEYDALQHAKVDQESTFLDVKNEKEREAAQRLEETEVQRQRKVDVLEEECANLQHSLDTAKLQHTSALQQLQANLAEARRQNEEHYQDVLAKRQEAIRKLRRQWEQGLETNRVTLRQLELDTDAESQTIQQRQQQALQEVREKFLHLKGEGAVMRKNATRLEREIEIRTNELQLLDGAKAALQTQLAALTHQVTQLHQDIAERDSVTEKKEKMIYGLKKQNQELEKHKYVLDHQIRELKSQIEPKQRGIAELNQETKNQNAHLEEQHTNNLTLRENTEELKKDIAEQQQSLKARLRELKSLETYHSRMERAIADLAPQLQDPVALAAAIAQLHATHVASREVEQIAPADPHVKQELQSQLEYLATSVDALRRKLKNDQQRHKKEVSAMMSENLSLIREIHSLRGDLGQLRTRVAADHGAKQQAGHRGDQRHVGGAGASGTNLGDSQPSLSIRRASMDRSAADTSFAFTESGRSERLGSLSGSTGRRRGPKAHHSSRHAVSQRPPTPPAAIQANMEELQRMRAYVQVLERTLAGDRPSSAAAAASTGSLRLPPVEGPLHTT